MTTNSEAFAWGMSLGMFVTVVAMCLALNLSKINISDAELYRFCMMNSIELKDCIISSEILDRTKEQPK